MTDHTQQTLDRQSEHTMDTNYRQRVKQLKAKLRRKKIDAILVCQPHNRRYLSGYTAMDHDISESSGALLIPARGKGYLLTDFRYQLQAEKEARNMEVMLYPKGLLTLLKKLLFKLDIKTLGFEDHYTLHRNALVMQESLAKKNISITPLTGLIEKMRLIKDEEEIALIRKSVRLNEEVFQEVFEQLSPKQTELDVALLIEQTMRKKGAEAASFESIVASGPNGALPHAVPSAERIRKNQCLTIDMGLILDGYCSDMTRNLVVGKPDKKYKKLHRLVRKAQLAGIKAIRSGATCKEVDKVARDIIAAQGYGKYFGHGLGHGVGLAVHEAPRLSSRSKMKLKPGMIVTVEPGVYIPDWGGIRLENMVVVRKDGCENLNSDTTWLDI